MKQKLTFLSFFAVILLLLFTSCEKENLDADVPAVQLKGYQSGTDDGYFWSLWTSDGMTGSVNYSNGDGGNYSVSWNCNGNFTCGKGWSTGDRNRIVGYNCGSYTHSGGGGSFAYYGWCRNPLMEYYVNEKWGPTRPTSGSSLRTLTTDGGTYNVYTAMRYNAPSIDGTQTFRQIFSTRTSQAPTGSNQTITFANHVNAWAAAGYGLGSDISPAAILLTEAYGQSSGYSNATVWSAGSSSGGGGSYYRIQNRATGLYLDGMGRTTNGEACGQYANTTHVNSQWIREASGGYERFKNRGTGMYIDGMGRTNNGADCGQWANTTSNNAQWSLEGTDGGYYRLRNRATGLYLDGMGRTSNGSAAGQWANTTSSNAQWRFVLTQ